VADQRQRDAYSLVIDLRGLGYHNTPPLHAIQKVRRGSGCLMMCLLQTSYPP
jgi:hypothetical protein